MIYSTYTYYIYIYSDDPLCSTHIFCWFDSHMLSRLFGRKSPIFWGWGCLLWGWASWYPVNSHQTHQTTISWICYTPKWAPATLTSSAPPFSARTPKPSTPPSVPSPGVTWPLVWGSCLWVMVAPPVPKRMKAHLRWSSHLLGEESCLKMLYNTVLYNVV